MKRKKTKRRGKTGFEVLGLNSGKHDAKRCLKSPCLSCVAMATMFGSMMALMCRRVAVGAVTSAQKTKKRKPRKTRRRS